MSAKDVGEAVGLLAVVGGLLFVGLEMRQNNQLARAAAYQAIGTSTAELWAQVAADPGLSELHITQVDVDEVLSWSRGEWSQFHASMRAFARLAEMTQLQVEQGLLPPGAMELLGYANARSWLRSPATACIWRRDALGTGAAFRRFVEGNESDPTAACQSEGRLEDLKLTPRPTHRALAI